MNPQKITLPGPQSPAAAPFNLITGNCLTVLKSLPDSAVRTCVTSPPYYGLRDYGTSPLIWGGSENCDHHFTSRNYRRRSGSNPGNKGDEIQRRNRDSLTERDKPVESSFCLGCSGWRGEFGLEPTPELFIEHLVLIFREVRRVLTPDGTLWLNLGDSYWGGKGRSGSQGKEHQQLRFSGGKSISKPHSMVGGRGRLRPQDGNHSVLKPKDLIGIPWMAAFALRADGWWLRQDCIWHKPNPMPESVKDRCTKAHEYIFLLSKSRRYFLDPQGLEEPAKYDNRKATLFKGSPKYDQLQVVPGQPPQSFHSARARERWRSNAQGVIVRNKRSVWTVPTNNSKTTHTATFSEKLVEPCVLAGSQPGDVVLDIFSGTATVGAVSLKNSRNYIGIDLNGENTKIGEDRLQQLQRQLQTADSQKL